MCVFAQGSWQVQNPLPTESYLLTVEPVTDNKIFAGGLGGTLLKTDNAGRTWTVQKFKDLVDIRGISFKDSLNGWLIDCEHIYCTSDGGESWDEVYIDADMSTYFFMDITCFDKTIYLFLKPQTAKVLELPNAKSLVYKSTDDGKTWRQLEQEIKGKMFGAFFLNESMGFIVVEETVSISEGYTYFYKTKDGGKTWSKSRLVGTPGFTSGIMFLNEKLGFVGKYKTTDGGSIWENMFTNYLPQSESVDDIYFTDSLNGWAVNWVKIFQTTDGGVFWKELEQNSTHQLNDINFSKNGTGWIVGVAGNIFSKSTGSDIWKSFSSGNKNNLNDVFFIDEKEGWCVGTFGSILHTSNGGETWEKQDSKIDSVLFRVKFLTNLEGWIAGHYVVLHTKDGGKNWEARNDLYGWFVDVDFFDDKNGLLIERFGNVYRTTDGGIVWRIANEQPLPRLTSVAIVNENEAWVGAWKGLGHTTNKGATIQWYDVPNLSLVKDIQFVDNNYGFLINDFAQFLRTTDGGWNWCEIPRGIGLETGPMQAFYMLDQKNGWIYWDYKGGYLRNVNINYTISAVENSQYSVPAITKIYFVDSSNGWAVGAGGTILKYTNNEVLPSETKSKLVDIFPNPLNNTGTNISFPLKQSQEVSIEIYNSIGQKVETIYNGLMNKGQRIFFWKPKAIASGVYFIFIRCNEFNQVQKSIFIHN